MLGAAGVGMLGSMCWMLTSEYMSPTRNVDCWIICPVMAAVLR